MNTDTQKRLLLVCRKAPYGNALSREAIEIALAAAVFDQNLAIAFIGDGVWQLLDDQQSEHISAKNQQKLLSALPLYDIDELYAEQDALAARNLVASDLTVDAALIDQKALGELLTNADIILNF